MRKLYAFLAGIFFVLAGYQSLAQTPTADVANFTFSINADNNDVVFTNTSVLGTSTGDRRAQWSFGDGTAQWTLPLSNTQHHYVVAGTYTVCLKIFRYVSNTRDSVLSAQFCLQIEIPVRCRANFERIPVTANTPLTVGLRALPWHNANKKPARICWKFGDGRDTCIQYPENYTGGYAVTHHYANAGIYEVCVNILYYGGCEARKCENIKIEIPDECRADFEKLPLTTSNSLLYAVFKALPWHNNNKKPARICWTFGDGRDTCINYTSSYTGPYTVAHRYNHPGVYEVCVKILYYGGCEARKCKAIQIGRPDECSADFERIPVIDINDPFKVAFKAILGHNNNRKPKTICWKFGDGRDTCIDYPENYTGTYAVRHKYNHAGVYEVCIKILYYGGCEARKCKEIKIGNPATCTADFERTPVIANIPTIVGFKAIPWNSQNRKPARICWSFGDGRDTCIEYPENYTGQYVVGHRYEHPGLYEVCVKILYYGGCEARKCKNIQVGEPATCTADFERLPVTTTNSPLNVYYKALPWNSQNRKPARICWTFGDGRDTCIEYPENYTGPYAVGHRYEHQGLYEVCVKILYYGGCEARKCKNIQVGEPATCTADFERLPVITTDSPLKVYYKALPWNSQNRKPARICWTFGDGRDTCIEYPENYTGPYAVGHRYEHQGLYEVCVKILYYGGCEARKCKNIQVGEPATCTADFERLPVITTDSPLKVYYKALPWNSQNRKPARICWSFGDGRDTCIEYPENYTGQYVVGHRYEHPGLYEVCVKILYYGGCEARKCKNIQVGEPATCTADFERAPLQDNNPLTIALKALPWNNQNRKPARICWTFGDGRDTCINYPENYTGLYLVGHRYVQPGTYEVCVKILYYGGCEAKKCKEITIPPPTVECRVRLFEITPSITSLVRGFYANASSTPERRLERICWYFGDGDDTCIMVSPTSPTPTPQLIIRHTYPGPGVYRACVKVRFVGGCEAYDCVEVTIRPFGEACGGFMVDSLAGPRTYKFTGHSITRPNDEVVSFRWTFGDGSGAIGREVIHTYAQGGDYRVCLTIVTRSGCETRICNTVRVPGNNEPQLYLTPNPVIDIVNVHFRSTHTETINIKILNSNGVPVRSFTRSVTVGPNTWTHDLSSLLSGVYSYNIQSANQQASVIFIKN